VNYKPVIILAGEPYSVFLEIFFKVKKRYNFKSPIILIVSKKLLTLQMKKLNSNFKINLINPEIDKLNILDNKKINIIDVDFNTKKAFDKITDNSNQYIEKCFKIALKLLNKQKCAGLINGPISKKNFLKEKFYGITEYLAKKTDHENKFAMLIYNKKLSVSPITTHLPLKKVHKYLSIKKIINHVMLIKNFYKKEFSKNPKIAITGLNPHCESNYRSSEENKIIKPAIELLMKSKIKVDGPFPADTIFMKEQSKKYDVIIGMYHDQVLTPAKTLFGFNAINITLGLPFIRISPDHGPNAQMVGKNLSNPQSLIEALKFLNK
jgi:4-hydroxythreonine-4-phosphate dehydrogenase